jgi:anti-repressor protein
MNAQPNITGLLSNPPPTQTMNDVIPFDFEGAQVRMVTIDREPYFVGNDVAERLGYTNPSKAMSDHCKGITSRYPLQTADDVQELRILDEPDVLRFIIKSKLPSADRFERWVFEEVLPPIRKTGGYMIAAPDETPEALALRRIASDGRASEGAVGDGAAQSRRLGPHRHGGRIAEHHRSGEGLRMRRVDLRTYLSTHGWIYRRAGSTTWLGYQPRTNAGDLVHKVQTILQPDGNERVC